MIAFALEDGVVYHTYSAYARGLDGLWGMYQWLDRAPKGRNETGVWFGRHDEYDDAWVARAVIRVHETAVRVCAQDVDDATCAVDVALLEREQLGRAQAASRPGDCG